MVYNINLGVLDQSEILRKSKRGKWDFSGLSLTGFNKMQEINFGERGLSVCLVMKQI